MPRPIRASINLEALRHNYALARSKAGQAKAYAVIKANAYGHGLNHVIQALGPIADGFALLDLVEARALRAAGLTQPIVLLEGFFEPSDLTDIVALGLTPTVHSEAQLTMLERAALGSPIDVMLKINSGMNRLGFAGDALGAVLARLRALAWVRSITLMTHFARADDEAGIAPQMARFRASTKGLDLPVSLANSAALLRFPEAAGQVVRPGIMLYGASPMPDLHSAEALGLKPVMTLNSEIIGVQSLSVGERVGYGGTFEAPGPMRIGVVACGYADGYPRHAPTGTPILVGGRRTRTLGRVSMDMLACDLTHLDEAGVGSPVTLWGDGLAADEVANAAGTISYELFCALAARVPVRVLKG
ncbi:MAG: alanine racemase [Zoogloea sp.]|uniref:alanine racemase n=1 Tax=Zoogloea sp. TaxID=49181 RepID=UPI002628E979|nr:alanine racemase [Zoogloea sp.]MDD2990742.1 alanine racemase [Zoogloea sp.]